jgi:hypothetical protein
LDQAVLNKIEDTDAGESVASRLGWEAQSIKQKTALTTAEVDSLLKYGAYALKDDDESAQTFVEENIEKILESRTRTVVRDAVEGTSTFSKASFASQQAGRVLSLCFLSLSLSLFLLFLVIRIFHILFFLFSIDFFFLTINRLNCDFDV